MHKHWKQDIMQPDGQKSSLHPCIVPKEDFSDDHWVHAALPELQLTGLPALIWEKVSMKLTSFRRTFIGKNNPKGICNTWYHLTETSALFSSSFRMKQEDTDVNLQADWNHQIKAGNNKCLALLQPPPPTPRENKNTEVLKSIHSIKKKKKPFGIFFLFWKGLTRDLIFLKASTIKYTSSSGTLDISSPTHGSVS